MLFRPHLPLSGLALIALSVISVLPAHAEPPRALPAGKLPEDVRLGPLRDLNGYFPARPIKSAEEFAKQKSDVRRQILIATGLWPMPTRTPLEAVVHGRIEMPDYTIEKVYFQSFPGHFVTGNLYRPKNVQGKRPGVLSPHGHFNDGRFADWGKGQGEESKEVRELLASGAERFVNGARALYQARCVQLARMGCVVFFYDMEGYADSVQLEHRPTPNPALLGRNLGEWGFYSPAAHLWLQSRLGLQTWNSIRALDFLLSLDDVDPTRIGVTGESGGGTQTMLLTALDDRITASMPAVMVSTAMQGGCPCENACCLRTGIGNIDIAACTAPRPLGLLTAKDWTIELPTKGFPDLQTLYQMLGHPDRLTGAFFPQFPHNYNHVSRAAMYAFFNRHFGLGHAEPVLEHDFEFQTREKLTVWDDAHPAPTVSQRGDQHERELLRGWAEDAQRQLKKLTPHDDASWKKYRDVVGGAVDTILGRRYNDVPALEFELTQKEPRDGYLLMTGVVRNPKAGEELPALFLYPDNWNRRVVLWVSPDGKQGLFDARGKMIPEVARLLGAGISVVGVDLLYQGEFLTDGRPLREQRGVFPYEDQPWGKNAVYTYGYNPALFARRVHDLLTMISFLRHHERQPESVAVVGAPGAGHWVAAACAQADSAIDRAVVFTDGFRFAQLDSDHHVDFLPGVVKYGDLPGLLALAAPTPLMILNEEPAQVPLVEAAYRAAGGGDKLKLENQPRAAIDWLLAP